MTAPEQLERPKVRRGQVVGYLFHDTVTGRDLDGLGVVVAVEESGNVIVRPLAAYDLTVDPSKVSPVSAGDVTA